jgi:hypothetical protein
MGKILCYWYTIGSLINLLMLIAVLQFLLSPLLLWKSFVAAALSCVLYTVALGYYHYLNFLGYSALPFLERTEVSLGSAICEIIVTSKCSEARVLHTAALQHIFACCAWLAQGTELMLQISSMSRCQV